MNVFTLIRMENTGARVDVKVLGTYKKQNDATYGADWDIETFKKNGNVVNQTQERSVPTALVEEFASSDKTISSISCLKGMNDTPFHKKMNTL